MLKQKIISIQTRGKGLHEITSELNTAFANDLPKQGMINVFIQHTSASLTIQENADPSARSDLEEFMERTVPENQSWYRHTAEGPDDTTSHIKSVLTSCSLQIPVMDQNLALGTWQGVYLWEHRSRPHTRKLILTLIGD